MTDLESVRFGVGDDPPYRGTRDPAGRAPPEPPALHRRRRTGCSRRTHRPCARCSSAFPFALSSVFPDFARSLVTSSASPFSAPSMSRRSSLPPPATTTFSNLISETDAIVKPVEAMPWIRRLCRLCAGAVGGRGEGFAPGAGTTAVRRRHPRPAQSVRCAHRTTASSTRL